ncbi:sodium:pantothenate symporter [Pontibacillus halophilus JSM 076056 = DSM 19796]|uniref:Sodium:pantothenate symporter n=1 Tax=Pontibacillus halophilus JSM 076056 = DSM 19796 TaxID=1385510 RepID=A0A0A5GFE8_9BACI|nr:sodium/pantothenate symporter [Pontibacillus halophilus]KGX91941.1 sodium:pantothenate symporter [Pontibacillus halophilus JSM 076056 = DSM 19796]
MNEAVWVPMVLFLFLIFFIGIWASRKKTEGAFLDQYFLGGRELGGFVLALTMTATYGSASSFIGGPGVAYNEGLGWVLLAMSQLVTGYFVLLILGKKFAIVTRKYKAVTLIDFLRVRYNSKWVVLLSALSIIIFLFSAMAAQWVGGARLIETMTGLSYTSALFLFAVSVLVYVVIGGFRAVALTDTVQGVIMFFGTMVLLVAVIHAGGGVSTIMDNLISENENLVTPFGKDRQLTPAYVSSFWILVGVGVIGLPQVTVRAMSYRNSRAMHRALIVGTIVVGFIMLNMHLIGVFARPILPGIDVGDKVMPLIAIEVLPSWVAGLVLAAPMAAIMSTVDSLLLLVSSAIVKDIYLNYVKPTAREQEVKILSIGVTAILGVLVFMMALNPPDLLIWLNLFAFGGLEAAFIWPVVLGLYWKRGNATGAIASTLVGITSYILIDQFLNQPLGVHPIVLPVLFSLLAYIIGSLATSKATTEVDSI